MALGVSPPAISKALPLLEKKEFVLIEKDKESARLSIRLNNHSKKVIYFKRVENLRVLYESGLVDYLIHELAEYSIVLFGSYSFGEDSISSDVDIAIIGGKDKIRDLSKFEKIIGKRIYIHFYESLKNVNKNLRENICNGILLKGGIEL